MTTVLIIIAIVGISLLVGYLRNKANKALAQKVFSRGNHAKGQHATKERIEFVVPVSAEEVRRTVRERLDLPTVPPVAVIAKLYLAGDEPGRLTFAFGTKVAEAFRSTLVIEDTATGASATYLVLSWVEGDGIVRGIPEMELLANSIRACAAQLGATYGAPPAAEVLAATPAAAPARFCTSCGSGYLGSQFCTECGVVVA